MKDGSDYTHSSDGASMYTNRDPRLAAIIGYDGSVYGKNTIYTRISDNTTIDGTQPSEEPLDQYGILFS